VEGCHADRLFLIKAPEGSCFCDNFLHKPPLGRRTCLPLHSNDRPYYHFQSADGHIYLIKNPRMIISSTGFRTSMLNVSFLTERFVKLKLSRQR
jgi:hypothetical protein